MVAEWWNGVELWVSGLAFPLQFALVMVLLGPFCVVVAWAIDRAVDHASTWFGPAPGDEEPIGTEHAEDADGERSADLVDSASR
ncbi:hypothetical protein [Actinophytocola algeriensis]|uniref:Uncharacterized protein n=1 Tax=Actinophytocola algeriensis TaxID=1768010 RepID=A0A7W7Q0E2_9PSEU|nr:hypothetical protein [Actinophytocola algeriensis]MBB4904672.1 hypothetical protein [Actinophytocola algeriensis]MBE1476469.1 hypothetical protein [Actinophytocola algeriensis]